MTLLRLTYVSTAARDLSPDETTDLVARAQHRNKGLSVTGILLFNGLNFLQTLEGGEPAVIDLMRSIAADDRHTGIVVIHRHGISERAFKDWSLGFSRTRVGRALTAGGGASAGNGLSEHHLPADLPEPLVRLYRSFETVSRGTA